MRFKGRVTSDERACPFCAETIKQAAVVCRWCGRDVPPVEQEEAIAPEPRVEHTAPVAPVEPVATEAAHEPLAEPAPRSRLGSAWLSAVLAVLVLCAAVLVGVQWHRATHPEGGVAPNNQLTDDDARTAVLVAAADLTQRSLSYSWKTLDQDMETARAKMAPAFRKQYDEAMGQVRANVTKNKIALQATAVSSSIVSATPDKAVALVFVNQVTTAAASRNQQVDQNRVVLTLTRSDGDWVVSKLTALG